MRESSANQLDDFKRMQKRLRKKLKRGDNKEEAFRKVIGDYYDQQIEERDMLRDVRRQQDGGDVSGNDQD